MLIRPLRPMRSRGALARLQRGLSLVELLVGVAVGLIVVAGATMLVSGQLVENRRLLVETQLQQDMRAAMDIVARELRRVGTQNETAALTNLWWVDAGGNPHEAQKNVFSDGLAAPAGGSRVDFAYQPDVSGTNDGPYGFQLQNGVIQTLLMQGGWQDLTDGNVMEVRTMTITPVNRALAQLPCAKACPDGTSGCWPTVQVRELRVAITARARSMPGVNRTMENAVRLRTDHVRFDPAIAPHICPT